MAGDSVGWWQLLVTVVTWWCWVVVDGGDVVVLGCCRRWWWLEGKCCGLFDDAKLSIGVCRDSIWVWQAYIFLLIIISIID